MVHLLEKHFIMQLQAVVVLVLQVLKEQVVQVNLVLKVVLVVMA